MPEVAEVAHACALLRRNVIGLSVKRAILPADNLLFPALKGADDPKKVVDDMEKQLLGATVESLGRHGKYFWLRFLTLLGSPLVMLMHFGMTGRIRLRNVHSHMIFMENGGDKQVLQEILKTGVKQENDPDESEVAQDSEIWPPKFTKFELFLANEHSTDEKSLDLAFLDPRRLARVRFLSGKEVATDTQLMLLPQLRILGPDYSKKECESNLDSAIKKEETEDFFGDPDPHHHGRPRLSFQYFGKLVLTKKKPIKAFLLDQEFFAGIGNWVSDEILYHARIHPGEVISSKINDPESPVLRRLYDAVVFVMEESVRVEGNAKLFPEDWLMLHRWGKGRKEPPAKTKLGHSVKFETIGGRTSCFVPELQKPLKKDTHQVKNESTDSTPVTDTPKKGRRKTTRQDTNSVKDEHEDAVKEEHEGTKFEVKRRRTRVNSS